MPAKKKTVTVEIAGKTLTCPVCGNTHFYRRTALLNTSVATFFGLDWVNRQASCFVCSGCLHISWFLSKPVSTEK